MYLSSFLATDRRQAILKQQNLSEESSCLLFIDVAGFSTLTRQMVAEQQARRGTEALLELLNQRYAELIEGIHAYAGSVIYFAGDALTCSFADAEAALRCALHLQALMDDKAMALKLSLSYGQVQRHSFGKHPAFDVPLGEAVDVLDAANALARANDIIITQTIVPLLSSEFQQQLYITAVDSSPTLARVQLVTPFRLAVPAATSSEDKLDDTLDDALLQPYVPAFLRENSHFITELRPCITLFCQISYVEQDTDVASLLQDFIPAVQACLAQQGGKILEFTTDDKGHVIYAPFGAPVAYKDDAIRACRSALAIVKLQQNFPQLALRLALHQGILRTGFIGSEKRRSYAMTGQATNATAVMMMQAEPNSIVISEALASRLPARFTYGQAQSIPLKGGRQLSSYALQAEQVTAQLNSEVMVGREAALEQLSHYIQSEEKTALQVIAEAGLGKSLLLRQAMHKHRDIPFYIGEAEPQQQQTAYYIWRFILRNLLHISSDDGEAVSQQLHQLLPANLHERLSLLAPVLAIALPEQDFAKNLSPHVRQQATSALIMEILEHVASQHFFVLVLEDCHWLDDLSQQLLDTVVARKKHTFALLMLSRQHISDAEDVAKLELTSLGPAAAQVLISSQLGAQVISENLQHLILEKAEGNPFYLEELLHYIKAHIKPHDSLEHIEELPATLHSLVLSRFDSLPSAQKTLLRVASVVGRYFNSQHLREYAEELQQVDAWDDKLDALLDKSFLLKEINRQQGIESDYFFKHILNQEIIYNSLSYRFREKLHEAYADFVLQNLEHELDILAYHYKHSANKLKAMEFLQKAGKAAIEQFANQTALHHYEDLLALQLEQDGIEPVALITTKLEVAKCYDHLFNWDITEKKCQELFVDVQKIQLNNEERDYQQAVIKEYYAKFLGRKGLSQQSYDYFAESLQLYQKLAKPQDMLRVQRHILIQYYLDYRSEEALELAEQLLSKAQEQGNKYETFIALEIMNYIWIDSNLPEGTLASLMDVYALATELNLVAEMLNLEEHIAFIKANQSLAEALPHFEKAISLAKNLGNMRSASIILANMAFAHSAAALYSEATDYIKQALELLPTEDRLMRLRFYIHLSSCALLCEDTVNFSLALAEVQALEDALEGYQYQQHFCIYIAFLATVDAMLQKNTQAIKVHYDNFMAIVTTEPTMLQHFLADSLTVYLSIQAWLVQHAHPLSEAQQTGCIQLLGFFEENIQDETYVDDAVLYRKPVYSYFYERNLTIFQQHSDSQSFTDTIAKGKELNEAEVLAWLLNVDALGI